MKLPQVRKCAGQLDDVARAADIHAHRELFRNGEIVNCREMKHARCLLPDGVEIGRIQPKPRLANISFDNPELLNAPSAQLRKTCDLFRRPRPQRWLDEQNESAPLTCETLQKPVRDETGKSGYEKCLPIRHQLPRV